MIDNIDVERIRKAREFCREVKKLAKVYDLPFLL